MAHLWAATVCISLITTKKELQYYKYCTLPCAKVTEDHRLTMPTLILSQTRTPLRTIGLHKRSQSVFRNIYKYGMHGVYGDLNKKLLDVAKRKA